MSGTAHRTQRHRERTILRLMLLWAVPLGFLSLFFLYPLGMVFRMAGQAAFTQGLSPDLWEQITRPLGFTLYQAALSTLLTFAVGLPGAYLFARFSFRGKQLLRVLVVLPFILPTVVVAASFNALIGPRGWVNLILMSLFALETPPVQMVQSLGGILIAHVFYNTSVVIWVVGTAWEQLDPRLEHAARALGASPRRTFLEVTLPLLLPSLLGAALLVFLFDFTSFGVVLLMGGPRFATLEVEIYQQAMQMLNLPLAGLLSAIQMLCTLGLTVVQNRLTAVRGTPLSPRVRQEGVRPARGWAQKCFVVLMALFLLVLLVAPLGGLALRSVTRLDANRGERETIVPGLTVEYYQELFINRRQSLFYVPPVLALRNSLVYGGLTVVFSLTLGLLTALALARRGRLGRWLDALIMLPLGASAVTLGLGYILAFNRPPLDVRSFPLLVPIAHSLVALPFVVRTLLPAVEAIPPNLRQAARTLGASPWRAWLEIDLPILMRAGLVSAIFSFTISLGEFGATSFLARPEMPTLPMAIFRFLSQPGALNYGQALAMSTILMAVCAASIFALQSIRLPGGE